MKQVFDAESSEIWGYCILKGAEIETIVLSFLLAGVARSCYVTHVGLKLIILSLYPSAGIRGLCPVGVDL